MSDWPTPQLLALAEHVAPGSPLPLRVSVDNPTSTPLAGASAELTLEIERGVLLTWNLALRVTPARSRLDDAVLNVAPAWRLPINTGAGVGHFRLVLSGSDGAWLGETELELPVVGA
jgi:hypothetical protein